MRLLFPAVALCSVPLVGGCLLLTGFEAVERTADHAGRDAAPDAPGEPDTSSLDDGRDADTPRRQDGDPLPPEPVLTLTPAGELAVEGAFRSLELADVAGSAHPEALVAVRDEGKPDQVHYCATADSGDRSHFTTIALSRALRSDGLVMGETRVGTFGAPPATAAVELLAAAGGAGGEIVIEQDPLGTGEAHEPVGTGSGLERGLVADLDGDGADDVIAITAEGSLEGWTSSATGALEPAGAATAGGRAHRLAARDLDGDGSAEVVVLVSSDSGAHAIAIFSLGETLEEVGRQDVGACPPLDLALGDLHGDGGADLVLACENDDSSRAIVYFLESGSRAVTLVRAMDLRHTGVRAVAMGDVDGDGHDDVVVLTAESLHVYGHTMAGLTALTSVPAPAPTAPAEPGSVGITDIDRDGDGDVFVVRDQRLWSYAAEVD